MSERAAGRELPAQAFGIEERLDQHCLFCRRCGRSEKVKPATVANKHEYRMHLARVKRWHMNCSPERPRVRLWRHEQQVVAPAWNHPMWKQIEALVDGACAA